MPRLAYLGLCVAIPHRKGATQGPSPPPSPLEASGPGVGRGRGGFSYGKRGSGVLARASGSPFTLTEASFLTLTRGGQSFTAPLRPRNMSFAVQNPPPQGLPSQTGQPDTNSYTPSSAARRRRHPVPPILRARKPFLAGGGPNFGSGSCLGSKSLGRDVTHLSQVNQQPRHHPTAVLSPPDHRQGPLHPLLLLLLLSFPRSQPNARGAPSSFS